MSGFVSDVAPDYLLQRESAKQRQRLVQAVAVAGSLLALLGAALLLPVINRQRVALKMVVDADTLQRFRPETALPSVPVTSTGISSTALPPHIVLLRQTGALRGLMINILAKRSTNLKEKGQVYESAQLAGWICELMPTYPKVWGYHAWDMAYNISVGRYNPEERWKWVYNGIKLLRDQGIPYNPKEINLYKELSWIFYHKVGDILDDWHLAYKSEWAVLMEKVLGPPRNALTYEEELDAFRPIATAPRDPAALIVADPEVRSLVEQLAELDLKPDADLLEFVARHIRSQLQLSSLLANPPKNAPEELRRKRVALLTDPKLTAVRDRLLACVRAKVLRDTYKLEPDLMLRLMEEFGPLDWRSAFAHSMYWSWFGDIVTRGEISTDAQASDSMNTVRQLLFCLQRMVDQGKLILSPNWNRPNQSSFYMMPDLDIRFIDPMHGAYLKYGKLQFGDDPAFIEGTAGPNYKTGHYNFLSLAVKQLYLSGTPANRLKAEEYYAYLRDYNRGLRGEVQEQYLVPLPEFVAKTLLEDIETGKGVRLVIGAQIGKALTELRVGQVSDAQTALRLAQAAWDRYMADKGDDRTGRRQLETLDVMYADVAVNFFRLPDEIAPREEKAQVWLDLDRALADPLLAEKLKSRAPVQQIIYDELRDYFVELCRQDPPFDVNKAFPEPPGMEDYRKSPVARSKPPDGKVSEGERDFTP